MNVKDNERSCNNCKFLLKCRTNCKTYEMYAPNCSWYEACDLSCSVEKKIVESQSETCGGTKGDSNAR